MAKASRAGKQPPQKSWSEAFKLVHLANDSSVELKIAVVRGDDVKAYGFAFDGIPVPMSKGKGKFNAPVGPKKLLEWVMIGNPGGTMKVTVTRSDTGDKVKEREKSTIPASGVKGFDAFEIEVS